MEHVNHGVSFSPAILSIYGGTHVSFRKLLKFAKKEARVASSGLVISHNIMDISCQLAKGVGDKFSKHCRIVDRGRGDLLYPVSEMLSLNNSSITAAIYGTNL